MNNANVSQPGVAGADGKGRAVLILLILAVLVAWSGLRNPTHSLDTIPYVALILSLDGVPDTELHTETYRRLQAELPPDLYQSYISGSHHRKRLASDPVELQSMLPLWAIKPLYIWSSYLAYKAGVDVVQATTVVSAISAAMLTFLTGIWLLTYFRGMAALAIGLAIALGGGLLGLSGLARPDGLSALLVFAGLYFLLEHRRAWLALLLVVIAVAARPDNILMAVLLGSYIAIMTPGRSRWHDRLTGLLCLTAASAIYLLIQHAYGGFGWEKTFYVSFIEPPSAAPLYSEINLTLAMYLKRLYWSVYESLGHWPFMAWLVLNIGSMIYAWLFLDRRSMSCHLLVLLCMTNMIHWLAYPSFDMRFFSATYLAMLCIMATRPPRLLQRRKLGHGSHVAGPV